MAVVAIAHTPDSMEVAVKQALGYLGLNELVRDRLVAVKPNETWASAEGTTGVTQANTLGGVLRSLKQLGPRELVVNGAAGAAETDAVFRFAGLMDALEHEGATFFHHNRPPFTSVDRSYPPENDVHGPPTGASTAMSESLA